MEKYIPSDILKNLTDKYVDDDVWQIHSGNFWLRIFLYKENQIKANRDLSKYFILKKEYFDLIVKFIDPYFSDIERISISFDSKENFDAQYNGNWYDYYH